LLGYGRKELTHVAFNEQKKAPHHLKTAA